MFLPIIRRFKNFFLKNLVNIDKLTKLFFRHYLFCSSQHRAKKDDGYGKFRKREKLQSCRVHCQLYFLLQYIIIIAT